MSAAEQVLARATAKGPRYEVMVDGTPATFSAAEVGHALAGRVQINSDGERGFEPLPDGAVRVLLLKYCSGDEKDYAALLRDLTPSSDRLTWEAHAAHATVCRAALEEFMTARRCPVCEGRRYVTYDGKVSPCVDCEGSGNKPHSAAARARACGIPFDTFRRRAAEAYYLGRLSQLHAWEEAGLRRVIGKLSDSGRIAVTRMQARTLRRLLTESQVRLLRPTYASLVALPGLRTALRFSAGECDTLGTVELAGNRGAARRAVKELLDNCTET